MEGWNKWLGKYVFLRTNLNRVYSGKVIEVDTTSGKPLIWITIIDKFDKRVTFVHSEIVELKEEEVRE